MIKLIKDIEKLREHLYFLLSYQEPTDISVVNCSQELDMLLVKYENLKLLINLNKHTLN